MEKLVKRLGIAIASILMACSMQAQAATVSFQASLSGYMPGWAEQYEYFYLKKPTDEHFVRTDSRKQDERSVLSPVKNVPVNSIICVPVEVDPWTEYHNYYFKVTKEGDSRLELTGNINDRKFVEAVTSDNGAGAGAGAGLVQHLPAHNTPLSYVDKNGRVFYKEHTACGE